LAVIGFISANSKQRPKSGQSWMSFPGVSAQLRALKAAAKFANYELMGVEIGYRTNTKRSLLSEPAFMRAVERARRISVPLIAVNIFELLPPTDLDESLNLLEQLEALDVPIFSAIHGRLLNQIAQAQRAVNVLHASGSRIERSERIKRGMGKKPSRGQRQKPSRTISARGAAAAAAAADAFAWEIAPKIDEVVKGLPEKKRQSYKAIARALNDHQVPTRRGGNWSDTQVKYTIERIERLKSED